jgi:4-hydroxy-L-threonine phosphate dehydrogenase PdxA
MDWAILFIVAAYAAGVVTAPIAKRFINQFGKNK